MSAYAEVPVPLARPQNPYPLETFTPTGDVEPPFIVVEGPEKSGKSFDVVTATTDPRISHCWWFEIGEKPCVSEYAGTIPGAKVAIVRHDGTIWSLLSLVEQISVQARDLVDHGSAPMIVIDTAAGEWDAVRNLAHARTMASPSVLRKIAANPAAIGDSHTISSSTWNDVIDLHYELIRMLQGFPGIAVMITRGKLVTAFDDDGKAIAGEKVYKVEGHKNLIYDASAHVRTFHTGKPLVMYARSAIAPRRPWIDDPRPYEGLPQLVFDALQYKPKPWEPDLVEQAHRQRAAGEPHPVPTDWDKEFAAANSIDQPKARKDALGEVWKRAAIEHQRFRTVPRGLLTRIAAAGHAAADEAAKEWATAWIDAHAEQADRPDGVPPGGERLAEQADAAPVPAAPEVDAVSTTQEAAAE